MTNKTKNIFLVVMCLSVLFTQETFAQKKKKDKKDDKNTVAPVTPPAKTIASVTSKCKPYNGLFNLFQDEKDGSVYMLIKKDQIGKEFIYFTHTTDGLASFGLNRGSFRDNKIFFIKRYFDKIEFVAKNTNFYFDPKNPLAKAADANMTDGIMLSEKVEAEDKEKGEILIKADKLLLGEDIAAIRPNLPPTYQGFRLGGLNRDKTKYLALKNYPKNTDVVVEFVFDNPAPGFGAGMDVADDRFISIKSQHSFIEMPQNNFKPRYDDPRVGYFSTEVNDMTSASATNYRDVIHRWNLEKKDPAAAISEPIEPIVYWIEKTTPLELREPIMKAGLSWNEAFEKAGFKNAVQIKVQSDTATWEAGDIRYNVLRWTSSPNPPFGGYGPSFVNPRTGQILGADIMLEYTFITGDTREENVFEVKNLPSNKGIEDADEHFKHNHKKNHAYCSLGHYLNLGTGLGHAAIALRGGGETQMKEFGENSLYYLILHEMGHTLGLNHNMKATQMLSPDEINNREITAKVGLSGSVMDYPAPNVALDKTKQGLYFTNKPGPYDLWAIEFAYSTAATTETAEKARLDKILARSTEPALTFGNDADDMRGFGGIDPRVMIFDHTNDMIRYGTDRFKLVNELLGKLKGKYIADMNNQSYHELVMRYSVLTGNMASTARVISRYVGGVYVERGFIGQKDAKQPFTPVPKEEQKRAMKALSENIFSPNAVKTPNDLYNYLQVQRRGFNFFGRGEDPRIHERMQNIHRDVLSHFFNPNTQQRILNTELYGNTYKLTEVMGDLTDAIFKEDIAGNVNTFRQNLQIDYVGSLLGMLGTDMRPSMYVAPAQSVGLYQLRQIKAMLNAAVGGDTATKAHRQHILFRIDKMLKN